LKALTETNNRHNKRRTEIMTEDEEEDMMIGDREGWKEREECGEKSRRTEEKEERRR
jgi:hypothetical protein